MPRRKVVVDIETIPCHDAQQSLIRRPRRSRGFIRAIFERFPSEEDIQQTALDWTLGRILCIGTLVLDDENRIDAPEAFLSNIDPKDDFAQSIAKEADALRRFWSFVQPNDYFIGHKILDFDLPFIWNRSLICNVRPSCPLHLGHKTVQYTFDTMQVWSHWPDSPQVRLFVSLDRLSKVLALGCKSGSGDQVYKSWVNREFDRVRDYCLNDVRLEAELYRKLTSGGSAPTPTWL